LLLFFDPLKFRYKNVEEVAIVKVLTAALIQEYLTLIRRWSTKLPAAFQLVAPNVQKMLGSNLLLSIVFKELLSLPF
jgi:hypothetical protein